MPPTKGKGVAAKSKLQGYANAQRGMELRLKGLTYEEIAKELGFSDRSHAYRAVSRHMQEAKREKADEVLELELSRLDKLQAAVWQQALSGDVDAIKSAISIMNRRAKYLNLDNPTQTDLVKSGLDLLRGLAEQLGEA